MVEVYLIINSKFSRDNFVSSLRLLQGLFLIIELRRSFFSRDFEKKSRTRVKQQKDTKRKGKKKLNSSLAEVL